MTYPKTWKTSKWKTLPAARRSASTTHRCLHKSSWQRHLPPLHTVSLGSRLNAQNQLQEESSYSYTSLILRCPHLGGRAVQQLTHARPCLVRHLLRSDDSLATLPPHSAKRHPVCTSERVAQCVTRRSASSRRWSSHNCSPSRL